MQVKWEKNPTSVQKVKQQPPGLHVHFSVVQTLPNPIPYFSINKRSASTDHILQTAFSNAQFLHQVSIVFANSYKRIASINSWQRAGIRHTNNVGCHSRKLDENMQAQDHVGTCWGFNRYGLKIFTVHLCINKGFIVMTYLLEADVNTSSSPNPISHTSFLAWEWRHFVPFLQS